MHITKRAVATTAATLLTCVLAVGAAVPANAAAAPAPPSTTSASTTSASTDASPVAAPVVDGTLVERGRTLLVGHATPDSDLMVRAVDGGWATLAGVDGSGRWQVDISDTVGRALELRLLSRAGFSDWVAWGETTVPVTPPATPSALTVTGLEQRDGETVLAGTGTPDAVILVEGARDHAVIASIRSDGRWSVPVSDQHAKRIVIDQRIDGKKAGRVVWTPGS